MPPTPHSIHPKYRSTHLQTAEIPSQSRPPVKKEHIQNHLFQCSNFPQYIFSAYFPLPMYLSNHAFPFLVSRYFCKRLFGLSGIVYSIRSLSSNLETALFIAPDMVLCPKAFAISLRDFGFFRFIRIFKSTFDSCPDSCPDSGRNEDISSKTSAGKKVTYRLPAWFFPLRLRAVAFTAPVKYFQGSHTPFFNNSGPVKDFCNYRVPES